MCYSADRALVAFVVIVLLLPLPAVADSPYAPWPAGPPTDPNWFPIGVWLQQPQYAPSYAAAGINQYIGLWQGPTTPQLSTLTTHGMPVLCTQNTTGLTSPYNPIIHGWTQQDEPDNAQWDDANGVYGPPVEPNVIIARYDAMKAADPNRPVFLNLGQGVVYGPAGYIGRGVRRTHFEDYPEYCKGADIVSFDVYPYATRLDLEPAGKPWYVAIGVDRLREWTNYEKPVWCFIECTEIRDANDSGDGPTPRQTKAEAWMALVHGAAGIEFFAHKIDPFDERGLLHEPNMLAMVTAVNSQVQQLAPVLNSATIEKYGAVATSDANIPVDFMVKQFDGNTYLFAVGMRDANVWAAFSLPGLPDTLAAEVIGESRTVTITGGAFADDFSMLDVHLYRISTIPDPATDWYVAAGNWSDGNSWNGGVPDSGKNAYVDNGGTATINQAGEVCASLTVGGSAGQSGTVNMTAGGLTVGGSVKIGSAATFNLGAGTLAHADSNLNVDIANDGLFRVTAGSHAVGSVIPVDGNILAGTMQIEANSSLSVSEIVQDTLTIGAGATLTIRGSSDTVGLMDGLSIDGDDLQLYVESLDSQSGVLGPAGGETPIPEPCSALTLLGGLAWLRRRRRLEG